MLRDGDAALDAVTCLNDHEGGRGALRVNRRSLIVARYLVIFVAIGAFAMKHRSSITAAQQLFDDTTSALLTNFRHK